FSVAAVLGLAGIYFEERWMTGSAIALLAGGLGLRFLPGSDSMRVELEDDQDDDLGQPAGEPSDGERQAG
ncbi:MAG: hypothetical protein OXU33_12565, partial [Gemmatimonadota bacterium]|nr:hypothetical protein [Gemmatimonadota bacterium]